MDTFLVWNDKINQDIKNPLLDSPMRGFYILLR